ncbi:MAG: hypothetical protein ACWGQW_00975 [bacterium]
MATWTIRITDVQYKKQEIILTVNYSAGVKSIDRTFTFDIREELSLDGILNKIRRVADQLQDKQNLYLELKALEGTVIPNA